MRKLTNRILIISSGFLILTIGISYFLYNLSETNYLGCATEIPQNFCGTVSPSLSENATEGKKIFNINCAACHKLDKKMTGPALRGINNKGEFPYENYVFDFITKEDSLNKINDKYTKILNEEYNYDFNHNFTMTKTEFEYLMDYVK
ncbi:cytochrome c [Lacinutrix neustonica]|uniref:Cytochrome c n=1 Tax=Lacinutrix neustonica TaxID=2980107 RepID=A0A9E8MXW8_9FLAO|nr:cytochrome c [Lacinutrix neustonica]WAC02920.1 cytochrome c [Lacinutrix neustonica]